MSRFSDEPHAVVGVDALQDALAVAVVERDLGAHEAVLAAVDALDGAARVHAPVRRARAARDEAQKR